MFFKKQLPAANPGITEEELIEYLKTYFASYSIEWKNNIIDTITLEIIKRINEGRPPTIICDAIANYYRNTHQLPSMLNDAVCEHIATGILSPEMVDAIQIFIDGQYQDKVNTTIH